MIKYTKVDQYYFLDKAGAYIKAEWWSFEVTKYYAGGYAEFPIDEETGEIIYEDAGYYLYIE